MVRTGIAAVLVCALVFVIGCETGARSATTGNVDTSFVMVPLMPLNTVVRRVQIGACWYVIVRDADGVAITHAFDCPNHMADAKWPVPLVTP